MRRFLVFIVIAVVLSTQSVSASDYCFEEAGREYNISPVLLYAIASVESGFNPKAINKNGNGTYDYGIMQINSSWYKKLGHETWMSLGDPCTNIKTGAMILKDCIDRKGHTWEAVGCYNAASKSKRSTYANKIYREIRKMEGQTASLQSEKNKRGVNTR